MAIVIFDLDGTAIDSGHRHATHADGSIDMEHWFANATPEMVAKDTILPLGHSMRRMYAAGHTIIICTARCFQPQDFKFLEDNDLPYHYLLKREGRFVTVDSPEYASSYHGFIGDGSGDAQMKVRLLTELALSLGYTCIADMKAVMFDDNRSVIAAMIENGVHCFDAIEHNRRLAA